jgi:hypothetical protein
MHHVKNSFIKARKDEEAAKLKAKKEKDEAENKAKKEETLKKEKEEVCDINIVNLTSMPFYFKIIFRPRKP